MSSPRRLLRFLKQWKVSECTLWLRKALQYLFCIERLGFVIYDQIVTYEDCFRKLRLALGSTDSKYAIWFLSRCTVGYASVRASNQRIWVYSADTHCMRKN